MSDDHWPGYREYGIQYASVCDGIGAVHVAWKPLGWRCAWTSEIDAYPAAVVEHHHQLPNFGDMTTIDSEAATHDHGPIDLLVGGTPCQSFSVAGLRRGLADPRGNLALVYLGLADRLGPRWVVWENVPGVLSSNGGRDFGAFLGALAKLGYGWAYRVLDAQYVRVESHARAVPQRRRRVFVVGHLGDWRRASEVLLERQSLCGHPPPRREAGQGFAADVAPSLVASGRGVSGTGETQGQDPVVAEVANPLTARMHKGINTTCDEGQTPVVTSQPPCVSSVDPYNLTESHDGAIQTMGVNCGTSTGRNAVRAGYTVRRLTPRECERLQGFPDDYTLVPYRGKPAANMPRYRALGNSMAVNVMAWIGQRIAAVEARSVSRNHRVDV